MGEPSVWMETAGWWNLWRSDLIAYLRERFGLRIGLLVFVLLLGSCAEPPPTLADGILRAALAVGLVLQFRVWDDLADRDRDRLEHPDRVLPRAATLVPFLTLLLLTFAINLALVAVFRPYWALGLFLAWNALLLTWYQHLRGWTNRPRLHSLLLLLKYPIFFVLIVGGATPRLLAAAVLVYLSLCVYEFLHDPHLSEAP